MDISQCCNALEARMVVGPREENNVRCSIGTLQPHDCQQTINMIMLKNCNYKPMHEIWEFDLRHGKFWIINSQNNIGASKRLIVDRLYTDETKQNDLQTWTSFLDWSSSHSQLNDISTIFNLSNNLDVFTPTIMNNVMNACKTWEHYKDYQSAAQQHL